MAEQFYKILRSRCPLSYLCPLYPVSIVPQLSHLFHVSLLSHVSHLEKRLLAPPIKMIWITNCYYPKYEIFSWKIPLMTSVQIGVNPCSCVIHITVWILNCQNKSPRKLPNWRPHLLGLDGVGGGRLWQWLAAWNEGAEMDNISGTRGKRQKQNIPIIAKVGNNCKSPEELESP